MPWLKILGHFFSDLVMSPYPVVAEMDQQQATFAERLRGIMEQRGITQAKLAEKVGIGQPAISMMLNRTCRPQRKTIRRIATALDVQPDDLWPAKIE